MDGCPYDADYFERGPTSGKSLYENYRWLPNLTVSMVKSIITHCGIGDTDRILDFGCAKGFTVKAFKQLGYNAFGMDCSKWAIDNCDPAVESYVFHGTRIEQDFDWIIAKDVLEHVQDLDQVIGDFQVYARKGIFAVVPLGDIPTEGITTPRYIVPEYEKDITHLWRERLDWWAKQFMAPGWAVTAQYRVKGVKDNYAQYERGNGFIKAVRI